MKNKVELIGTYGSDEAHALSAWTSTGRDLDTIEKTGETKRERIPKLLMYLATNGHHTPFEKSSLHFLVTSDIASHIHIIKHRINVSVNAESARYKELKDDKFYVPDDWSSIAQSELERHCKKSFDLYHETIENLVESGIGRKRAKESARFFLPYANQIQYDVMFNFRSFMHFQGLRNSEHAQKEIRDIAKIMLELVRGTDNFNQSLASFGY